MQLEQLIDGRLVAGEGEPLAVLDPATEAVVANLPEASQLQADQAVSAAVRAFES